MSDSELKNTKKLMSGAISRNFYDIYISDVSKLGYRTNAMRLATHSDKEALAFDFLVNSNLERLDKENEDSITYYLEDVGVTLLSCQDKEELISKVKINLPDPTSLDISLGQVIGQRRSHRHFTGDTFSLQYLSTVLRAANGISAELSVPLQSGGNADLLCRTVPSGGGLYPIDIYFIAQNIEGLKRAVYRYHPAKDLISEWAGEEVVEKLLAASSVPDEFISLSRANCIFFLCGQTSRSVRKYGAKGLRFVFHEAGGISQNIHLTAAGLGVGSVDCASFYDRECHDALGFDGTYQIMAHTIVMGTI